MSQQNVDAVHRLAAAVGRRDVDEFLELSDPAIAWHSSISVLSEGGAYHGHEGVRQYFRDLDDTFESFEVTLDRVLDVGDLVLAVGRLDSCGKTSGVETATQMGWVFWFRHGKAIYGIQRRSSQPSACRSKPLTPTPDLGSRASAQRDFQRRVSTDAGAGMNSAACER